MSSFNELRNPSRTVPELLDTLRQHVPNFVNLIRKELDKNHTHIGPALRKKPCSRKVDKCGTVFA
jgi:hypothetical protein